jgi:hypothetical protein
MTTVPIRIILQGLIALFPQTDTSGSQTMTALLVNGGNKPSEMVCFVKHTPLITFPTTSQDCRKCPGNKYNDGLCTCPLARHEISILPQPVPGASSSEQTPHGILPFDRVEAANIWYVANLSRINFRPHPSVLPGSTAIPLSTLVARFSFPFNTAASCRLVTRREAGADYVYPFGMRALGTDESATDTSQAMVWRVETTTAAEVDTSVPKALKLRLTLFPGEAPDPQYPIDFELPTDLKEVDITLSNEREHFMEPDNICDDGIGRDFAFFYDLVDPAMPWNDRKVPHVKYSQSKSRMDLVLGPGSNLCLPPIEAVMSRPICPMASF